METAADNKRVLVVRVGALGDTLMATPVLRALSDLSPTTEIDFLCSELARPLLESNPRLSMVHSLKWRNLPYWASREKRKLVRRLKGRNYRFAVLLESASRYRQLIVKAGIREVRSFKETPFDHSLHSAVNNLRAAQVEVPEEPLHPELFLADEDLEFATQTLSGVDYPRVGLHAGYGPLSRKTDQLGRRKGWQAQNFRHLGALLIESGVSVVLTGSPQDRADSEQIVRGWPEGAYLNLTGSTTVRQLSGVLSHLQLFISVDSGPAHMAAAVGTPLVVLWGPAKIVEVLPLSSCSTVRVIRHDFPCSPCYDTPAMRSCLRNVCMQSIRPLEVFRVAEEVLEEVHSTRT